MEGNGLGTTYTQADYEVWRAPLRPNGRGRNRRGGRLGVPRCGSGAGDLAADTSGGRRLLHGDAGAHCMFQNSFARETHRKPTVLTLPDPRTKLGAARFIILCEAAHQMIKVARVTFGDCARRPKRHV